MKRQTKNSKKQNTITEGDFNKTKSTQTKKRGNKKQLRNTHGRKVVLKKTITL